MTIFRHLKSFSPLILAIWLSLAAAEMSWDDAVKEAFGPEGFQPEKYFNPDGSMKPPPPPRFMDQDRTLDKCLVCRMLVDSFQKGLKRTAGAGYDGGDSHWESNKRGGYGHSEIRLVEIQEQLCQEYEGAEKSQCQAMAESAEDVLEGWWTANAPRDRDLFEYVCKKKLDQCPKEEPQDENKLD